ncbi:MAG: NAD-binding protein [Chitinophagales bacterium]|nr:NAD-binding protein [Chitinophagales bacterium]
MQKKQVSFKERFRYNFENTMSSGPGAVIKWLAIVSLVLVAICGLLIFIFGIKDAPDAEQPLGFFEGSWQSLMATLDSGTMGGDAGWPFRIVRFLATLGGIFIISILIGTISSGIDEKIDELKKGRSNVLETNHTLILGWSGKIFSIINQIAEANANQKNPRIVILANQDKVEMEDEIRSKCTNLGKTKIVVRSGSPLEPTDIQVVNPNEARSIIVLAPEEGNADTAVIKSVLAITNGKKRKAEKYHIVAEIQDVANMEAAELVGGDEAVFVLSDDVISRVTAQTCRQSGLSIVYSELLMFEGDEIYFQKEPALVGKTFKDAIFAYEDSSIIGLFKHSGEVLINPSMDTLIASGDEIIAISEDDDTVVISGKSNFNIDERSITSGNVPHTNVEKTLILGWNNRGENIIRELDNYVKEGSEVVILADLEGLADQINDLQNTLSNNKVVLQRGNITDKATLEKLQIEIFDHIIILSYTENIDIQESDAKTLICLLHLRNLAEKHEKDFSIVSEMLDIRNRELAEVAKADDFIVSDNLISLMMSQLSENKELKKVYDILFTAEGSEMYLKPASNYILPGKEVNFYTLLESAAQKGEIAIGYRIASQSSDAEHVYGVVINPQKSKTFTLTSEDKVIVLAED